MKIFIDTNIFLDLLLNRRGSENAKIILNGIQNDIYEAYAADITLLNIDYIAKKQIVDIRKFLSFINDNVRIHSAGNKEFTTALEIPNTDLEDNIQYLIAKENGCDFIISNDTNFYKETVKIISSKEFVEHFSFEKRLK